MPNLKYVASSMPPPASALTWKNWRRPIVAVVFMSPPYPLVPLRLAELDSVAGMVAARWIACRMRRYVPQRHMLPFMAASIWASVGFGVLASSAAAVMSCPAWQYPHWGTSSSSQARCNACRPSGDNPSMVVMSAPATADTGVTHERVATPFTCTVQAPQCAPPQPNLVPFMSRTSRNTQSSGISLGTSTVVGFPLTLNVTGIVDPFAVLLLRFAS